MRAIVIIGGGFSGAMLAVNLARHLSDQGLATGLPGSGHGETLRVIIVERTGRFGRGVAYSTRCDRHVLNVPAGRMSAFGDRPDHFFKWLQVRDPSLEEGSFVPRRVYGEYIEEVLTDAQRATGSIIERVADEAVEIDRRGTDGASVLLRSGRVIAAERVVLSLGNFAPACPLRGSEGAADPRYIADPWSGGWREELEADKPVLLIGTGLTMVDIALELRGRGHLGTIHAVSRRGLVPQAHRSPPKRFHPTEPANLAYWPRTARGLLRSLRREIERGGRRGLNWREVVTSIRHATPSLWASLDERERRRFLMHLRSFWETHRHRTAPEAAAAILEMRREGQLRILAGRLVECNPAPDALRVVLRLRGRTESAGLISLHPSMIINCTGPETNLERVGEPLIVNLRQRGLIRSDRLGLGLDVDAQGAVWPVSGDVSKWLYALGPLRKGSLWETTAVPELRVQAEDLARHIAERLSPERATNAREVGNSRAEPPKDGN